MTLKRIIVWFRRDLRVQDHAALWHATQIGVQVIPLFILDATHFANTECGSGRVAFLLACLDDLDRALRERGSRLTLLRGVAQDVLPAAVRAFEAQAVYYSADIERWSGQQRDRELAAIALREGWRFEAHLNYYVQTSGEYTRAVWGERWTAFSRERQLPAPERIVTPDLPAVAGISAFPRVPKLSDLGLAPNQQSILPGGETAGIARMGQFLATRIEPYRYSLSKPIVAEDEGTSRMSPYFKFGCISQRSAIQAARKRYGQSNTSARKSLEAWVSRLRWRDHFVQKFALYPHAEFENLYAPFDAIRRPEDANLSHLEAWQSGRTGFPLIDASMRALTSTGMLNFRMRAMLATFLTLNLMQAWQHGAAWFMKYLLDVDATVDHWQWQMQAGITQPTASFVRCYNPTKQCVDNDPDARFIHKYVPELRSLPAPMVFMPWRLTPLEQSLFGVRIGVDYPAPIVDADETRRSALAIVQPIRAAVAAAPRVDVFLGHAEGVSPLITSAD